MANVERRHRLAACHLRGDTWLGKDLTHAQMRFVDGLDWDKWPFTTRLAQALADAEAGKLRRARHPMGAGGGGR